MGSEGIPLPNLRLVRILYGAGRGRDPDAGFGRDGVLAAVVLACWSAWGVWDKWIRVPDDGPVFPVYGKLGTVDLWLCLKLYGNFKRKSQSPPSEVWWRLKIMHSGAFLPQSNQFSHHGPHQAPAVLFLVHTLRPSSSPPLSSLPFNRGPCLLLTLGTLLDPPLLLRDLLPLQWRRSHLRPTTRLLALLDVLRQPEHLLDRRGSRCHAAWCAGHVLSSRDGDVQSTTRTELRGVRGELR